MKILVTGGCGYIGSALIPHLLARDHQIVNLDAQWFGHGFLPQDNEHLTNIKTDLGDTDALVKGLKGCQVVIHLAGMTSDTACRDNPKEARDANVEQFNELLRASLVYGVKRFIFLSSSAAYGNTGSAVGEMRELSPTTPYGIYKKECEEILKGIRNEKTNIYVLRPAGVFGYAPRMRFDLMVNMMTAHAALKGEIQVAGGEQVRPHLHIRDLIEVIIRLLTAHIPSAVFNVVHENQAVMGTANIVKDIVGKLMKKEVTIHVSERTDDRSYAINGEGLQSILSFKCRRNIRDGVAEICRGFQSGQWKDALDNRAYANLPQL